MFENKRHFSYEPVRKLTTMALLMAVSMIHPARSAWAQATSLLHTGYAVNFDPAGMGGGAISNGAVPAISRPALFHGLAAGITASTLGVGMEFATPLASRLNLVTAGYLFSHASNWAIDGINVDSELKLSSMRAGLEVYPFRRSSVHLTPGVLFSNHNRVTATAFVPGGNTFSPGNGDYMSSPSDPVNGSVQIPMIHTAPALSIGVGSLFPRSGRHWSVPFEAGIAYIGPPKVALNLSGSICSLVTGICQPIATDPNAEANIGLEARRIQNNFSPLKTYPVVSTGFFYSFGHFRR